MKELKKYARIAYTYTGIDVSESVELSGTDDEASISSKLEQVAADYGVDDFKVSIEYTYVELAQAPLV